MSSEPAGTRIQVLQGFSCMLLDFLAPQLPPVRRPLECQWPKWDKDHWRFHFNDENEITVAVGKIYPDGTCSLQLLNIDAPVVHAATLDPTDIAGVPAALVAAYGQYPAFDLFMHFISRFGNELLAHLTQVTRRDAYSSSAPISS